MIAAFTSSFLALFVSCGSGENAAHHAADVKAQEQEKKEEPAKKVETPAPAAKSDALAMMRDFIATKKFDKSVPNWKTTLPMPPKMSFDPATKLFWVLETNEGPIKIRLMPDVAPMHVSSTIFLTEVGFYDGLSFHRVITGFMAQGGCPLGTGTGGPGYKFSGEFSPTVKHSKPGLLSMANAGPGTDGSQFFLTFVPTPHLDNKHTIFGEIVEGMDTLKKLEAAGSQSGKTTKPLSIKSAKITVE
jgi:cyclophilin family peptidyl-prolyl cis-trans isomerase